MGTLFRILYWAILVVPPIVFVWSLFKSEWQGDTYAGVNFLAGLACVGAIPGAVTDEVLAERVISVALFIILLFVHFTFIPKDKGGQQ